MKQQESLADPISIEAHPCNNPSAMGDVDETDYPSTTSDSGSISPPKIHCVTTPIGLYDSLNKVYEWTSWSYSEYIDKTEKGWGECETGIWWGDTVTITIGGGFNLQFPISEIASFTIYLPESHPVDVAGPFIPPERNHKHQFVSYKKKGVLRLTGTQEHFTTMWGIKIYSGSASYQSEMTVDASYYVEHMCCVLGGQ